MPELARQSDPSSTVVITGAAVTTCLGIDAEATWRAVLQGRNGMAVMPAVESVLPPGSNGGQAVDLPLSYRPELPREARYLRWTVEHALRNANVLANCPYESVRCVTALGTTLHGIRAGGRYLRAGDLAELKSFLAGVTSSLALSGLGLSGGAITTCSACSSSLGAIALGVTLLETGQADMVVAGGYDVISEYAWAGFNSLRLIAEGPLRPFCRGRKGMKIAEGYGIVVLERSDAAMHRRAKIIAKLVGWGESADAHHLTQPHPQGDGALAAMRQAVDRSRIQATDLGMIAAHATGTQDNDAAEYHALSRLFGADLSRVPVIGFKSLLGHTLGGAGAVELILSALAVRDQIVPACNNVDPGDIEYPGITVACGAARKAALRFTLNASFGFGGANTSMVLAAPNIDVQSTPPNRQSANEVTEVKHVAANSRSAWITGIGVLLPGTIGPAAFHKRATQRAHVVPGLSSAALSDADLVDVLNMRRARRLSQYVKFSLAATSLALRDAGLSEFSPAVASASGLLGSMHGSADMCVEYYSQVVSQGALAANPVLFAEGVPNAAAAHLSILFGVKGSCQTIIGSRTAGLDALALASLRVKSGVSDTVIVVAAEENNSVAARAYREFGLQANEGDEANLNVPSGFHSRPGALAFVVESSEAAKSRGIAPYAALEAVASASFGQAKSVQAVASVLDRIDAPPNIVSSACHTWIDRAELLGIRRWGRTALVSSPYDCFGETFSATPLVGIADVLSTGQLPATTLTGNVGSRVQVCRTAIGIERFVSLCTDWTGDAIAMSIRRMSRLYGVT